MITERISQNMGKALISIAIATLLLLVVGFATTQIAGAKKVTSCIGTYLIDLEQSEALWTLSQDGTFQGTDSAEEYYVFGHQQGAWESAGNNEAKVTWIHFYNDPVEPLPLPQSYGRVDAELAFESDCDSLTGTLDLRIYEHEPWQDPLDKTGGVLLIDDLGFIGRRVNP